MSLIKDDKILFPLITWKRITLYILGGLISAMAYFYNYLDFNKVVYQVIKPSLDYRMELMLPILDRRDSIKYSVMLRKELEPWLVATDAMQKQMEFMQRCFERTKEGQRVVEELREEDRKERERKKRWGL